MRFIHEDVSLEQLQSDTYYEFGDFVDGAFRVTSSEKEGKIAILEMEKIGSIKDTKSNNRNPVRITKDIYVEDNEIEVRVRVNFEEIAGDNEMLNRIINSLYLAVDLPFFFNGDTNKFLWESNQGELKDNEIFNLLEPSEHTCTQFKVYDESYDLRIEVEIMYDLNSVKVIKFPIIAYAYTEEGYKEIYQGFNVTPLFNIDRSFEFHFKIKSF
jgi:hypothetical protein